MILWSSQCHRAHALILPRSSRAETMVDCTENESRNVYERMGVAVIDSFHIVCVFAYSLFAIILVFLCIWMNQTPLVSVIYGVNVQWDCSVKRYIIMSVCHIYHINRITQMILLCRWRAQIQNDSAIRYECLYTYVLQRHTDMDCEQNKNLIYICLAEKGLQHIRKYASKLDCIITGKCVIKMSAYDGAKSL